MIQYKIKELLAKKSAQDGRKISLSEVAKKIGVQRAAMSKLASTSGYVTTTRTLNALCKYFGCKIDELVEYVDD